MAWSDDFPTSLAVAAATSLGVLLGWMVLAAATRLVLRRRDRADLVDLLDRVRRPIRLLVALATFLVVASGSGAGSRWTHPLQIAVIVAGTWTGVSVAGAVEAGVLRRFDVSGPDNRRNRGIRTQATVIHRVLTATFVTVGAAAALFTFPTMRTAAAGLLASAGLAGLVAGLAGRSTLGNVIAGIQIAFASPVRLDDVVVVEGEWGRIEEITLTYVVVSLWDWRRLVLPTAHFVEQPFQNWTRRTADVLGSVHLHVGYGFPVDDLRPVLDELATSDPRWDGNVAILQVVDATEMGIELRVLVSASNAPDGWDLRCAVREGLVAWIAEHHPDALPRLRTGVHREPSDSRPERGTAD